MTHKKELAEKHHYFPERQSKSASDDKTTNARKEFTPLYAESINMFEGLVDKEVDRYLTEHPKIVPLFEVDVAEAITPYMGQPNDVNDELDREAIPELCQAQESLEREMAMSQRVKASQLEEVNLGMGEERKSVQVAKEMPPTETFSNS